MRYSLYTSALIIGIALPLLYLGGCDGNPADSPSPVAAVASSQGETQPVVATKPQAHPFTRQHIYADVSAAPGDIASGLKQARSEHKRVLLDFGGDWCGDCQVLDIYFHEPENLALLEQNFVLVHVNVGRIDQNLDIGEKYGVDLKKGVPALAVLAPTGKALYGQSGQFSDMRYMQSASVRDFLTRWKAR